jgi:polyhydroxybutyrate depolymerase
VAAVALLVLAPACSDDGGDGAGGDERSGTTAAGGEADATGEAQPEPSEGCREGGDPEVSMEERTLDVRATPRRFLVTAPQQADGEPLPLVLDFHGLAEGANIHAQMTQLGPLGIEEGFVTVFPHGTGEPVRWNPSIDPAASADLEYVGTVLDQVEADRCIDTSRVYATGLSNGAMMSSAVACAMADRIAAIAPIAGVMFPDGCAPSRPVPLYTVHGTADPILLFNGGVGGAVLDRALGGGDDAGATTTTTAPADLDGAGYPETVRRWAEALECDDPSDDELSDEVIRRSYDCPDGTELVFDIVEGGGHSWPSSEFSKSIGDIVGPTTFDIDASEELWGFVSRFRLPPG